MALTKVVASLSHFALYLLRVASSNANGAFSPKSLIVPIAAIQSKFDKSTKGIANSCSISEVLGIGCHA